MAILNLDDDKVFKEARANVHRQLQAIGAKRYQVDLYDSEPNIAGNQKHRPEGFQYSSKELLENLPWLWKENRSFNRANIYISPQAEEPVIGLCCRDEDSLNRLKRDGLTPNVIIAVTDYMMDGTEITIEHDAWLRLDDKPMSPALKESINLYLWNKYDANPLLYSSLPGFRIYAGEWSVEHHTIIDSTKQIAPRAGFLRIKGQELLDRGLFVEKVARAILQQKGRIDPERPGQSSYHGNTYSLQQTSTQLWIERKEDPNRGLIFHVKDGKIQQSTLEQQDARNFAAAQQQLHASHKKPSLER